MPFSTKKDRVSLRKMTDSRTEAGKVRDGLEHLVVSENKEVLKKRWRSAKRTQESSFCWPNLGHLDIKIKNGTNPLNIIDNHSSMRI